MYVHIQEFRFRFFTLSVTEMFLLSNYSRVKTCLIKILFPHERLKCTLALDFCFCYWCYSDPFCVLYMPARKNMLGYFSADVIFSEKRSVFRERNHKLKEQIMSNDEYPVIFSRQMEATVFINLLIFFSTVAVLKIGEISRL